MTELINYIIWSLVIFSIYFQVPYKRLSSCIVPLFALYLLINIRQLNFLNRGKKIYGAWRIYVIFITLSSLYSIICDTNVNRVLRFYMILFIIPICFLLYKNNFEFEYKMFIVLSVAKSLYLISIAARMMTAQTYEPFRRWAQMNNYGDAYFVYGFMPRVQIYGNALLVLAFIVRICRIKKFDIWNILLLSGICIAGNFSFLLGTASFLICFFIRTANFRHMKSWKALIIVLSIPITVCFLSYSLAEMGRKADGGNSLKMKQISFLMDTNYLVGKGIARNVEANLTLGRQADADYYEMQTFYIFYQIGLFGIVLFYYITLSLCRKYGKNKFMLYLIFLLYTFFNPYCFDTTQMIAIVVIINMREAENYVREQCNCDGLLSYN